MIFSISQILNHVAIIHYVYQQHKGKLLAYANQTNETKELNIMQLKDNKYTKYIVNILIAFTRLFKPTISITTFAAIREKILSITLAFISIIIQVHFFSCFDGTSCIHCQYQLISKNHCIILTISVARVITES